MVVALTVLLIVPQAMTPQAAPVVALAVQTQPATAKESTSKVFSKEAFLNCASLESRNDRAQMFAIADENPAPSAPVQPGTVESASASASQTAAPRQSSVSPLSAGRVSPFLVAPGSPRAAKTWYALAAASHGAATFDAWTTRRVLSSGAGHELNPLLRPFAGSSALYAAVQVGPTVFDYLGKRMMTSRHGW